MLLGNFLGHGISFSPSGTVAHDFFFGWARDYARVSFSHKIKQDLNSRSESTFPNGFSCLSSFQQFLLSKNFFGNSPIPLPLKKYNGLCLSQHQSMLDVHLEEASL